MHNNKFSSLIFSRAKKSNTKKKKIVLLHISNLFFYHDFHEAPSECIHGFVFTRKCVRETIVHTQRDFVSSD